MENMNNEQKKVRKPRLPKLQRKFVNVQEMLQEIQEDVALALKNATDSKKIDPKNIDFSQLSIAELAEIQARLSAAFLAKTKDINK